VVRVIVSVVVIGGDAIVGAMVPVNIHAAAQVAVVVVAVVVADVVVDGRREELTSHTQRRTNSHNVCRGRVILIQ